MKKPFLFCFLCIFCFLNAFCQSTIPEFNENQRDTCWRCPYEKVLLPKENGRVDRKGGSLIFHLQNGKNRVLSDNVNGDVGSPEDYYFRYRGYLWLGNLFVVEAAYYEGGGYVLINAYNGDTTNIGGKPYVSPDAKHILIVHPCMTCIVTRPNIFEVWNLKHGKPRMEYDILEGMRKNFEAHNPIWLNNNTISFRADSFGNDQKLIQVKAKAYYANNKWKLSFAK